MTEPPPPPPPPEYGQPYGQGGQPWGQGQPYGQPPYGQPQQTSTKAVVALVLGIVGVFFCSIFVGIAALVVGRSAVNEVDASGGRTGGRGMAKAGWILGIVDIVLGALELVFVFSVYGNGSLGTG